MSDRHRFVIVGTGRSGSSLLSAILADSGADFGMSDQDDWDRESGAFEHPNLHRAYDWISRAEKISKSLWPNMLGRNFCQRMAQRNLSALFHEIAFAKSSQLIWMVQEIHKLGYHPKIIVSYRDFGDYCRSRYLRFGWDFSRLKTVYYNVYQTALLQLRLFGGCTVSYQELLGRIDSGWIEVLSELTSLDPLEVSSNRDRRLEHRPRQEISLLVPPEIDELFEELKTTRGRLIDSTVAV